MTTERRKHVGKDRPGGLDRPSTVIHLLDNLSARAAKSSAGCFRQVALVLTITLPVLAALTVTACVVAINVDVSPMIAAIGALAVSSLSTGAAAWQYVQRYRLLHRSADAAAPPKTEDRPAA